MSDTSADQKVVPHRHPGRWVATVIIAVLVAMLIHTLAFSSVERGGQVQPRFQWSIIGEYLTTKSILVGLGITIIATVIAMIVGIALGVVLAIMRLSPNPIVSGTSWTYIWFFRGTPVLVQILFWFNIGYIFPMISLGIPFGPSFVSLDLAAMPALVAGVLALGLNEGAYMAEIVRVGLISVDSGQTEAASSLGMSRLATLRRIVLPQAMRVIIPVTGNETISMLKTSSLLSVIAVGELTFKVQAVYSVNYETVPLLIVASIWYLIVTTVLSIGQFFLERRFSRGLVGARRVGFLESYWTNFWNSRRKRIDALQAAGAKVAS